MYLPWWRGRSHGTYPATGSYSLPFPSDHITDTIRKSVHRRHNICRISHHNILSELVYTYNYGTRITLREVTVGKIPAGNTWKSTKDKAADQSQKNFIFSMVQKKMAYLEIHTYNSRYKSQIFFLNQMCECCCTSLPLDATRFENGYSTGKELVSAVGKQRVTAVQHTFSTQIHTDPTSRVAVWAWYKKL